MLLNIYKLYERRKNMKYPHAHSGVKKIFVGALLELITSALMIAVTILLIYFSNLGDLTVTLTLVASIISVVAFIFQLIGLFQARKDESSFSGALWSIFLVIILTIAQIPLSYLTGEWVKYVTSSTDAVKSLLSIAVIMYILAGISNLADSLGESGYAARGRIIRVLLMIVFIAALGMRLVSTFVKGSEPLNNVMSYVSIGSAVIELIANIWYFFYLARAPKKLSK